MKGGSILIVDDSPVSRKILRSCLPPDGRFTVTEAGDGAAALQRFREHRPDVTFLDLTMPRVSGLECLAALKALAQEAVVVVVSADIQASSRSQALALGAAGFLAKPPTREAVAEVLARVAPGGPHV
jgi:two-component system chemotaxis response regulator CheY